MHFAELTKHKQDLCIAALTFCYDTLRTGGNFLCKFYQGGEDKAFEMRLRKLFEKVHREKPESSRSVRILNLSTMFILVFSTEAHLKSLQSLYDHIVSKVSNHTFLRALIGS